MMNLLPALLGSVGLGALIYANVILAILSRKFGEVVKTIPPYYRGYYGAIACLSVSLLTRLLRASVIWNLDQAPAWLNNAGVLLLAYHLPLAVGVTAGLAITWRYWRWLLKEQG